MTAATSNERRASASSCSQEDHCGRSPEQRLGGRTKQHDSRRQHKGAERDQRCPVISAVVAHRAGQIRAHQACAMKIQSTVCGRKLLKTSEVRLHGKTSELVTGRLLHRRGTTSSSWPQ